MNEVHQRYEDMSSQGQLRVILQEDGDVIISVMQDPNERPSAMPSVEFCSCGAGGGKSPHTLKALRELYSAIQRDNEESPQSCEKVEEDSFNSLFARAKWSKWEKVKGKWFCPECGEELEDGPKRSLPFSGASVNCDGCCCELTRRTGGGQSDPFNWIFKRKTES